jgi:hypothetical protein
MFAPTVTMSAVWRAWMGFAWFANFFDPDDAPYRLMVLVQLLASLALASGIPHVFQDDDFRIMTGCYVAIRISTAAQGLRAGRANPHFKNNCTRWAAGIWTCPLFWIAFAFTRPPQTLAIPLVSSAAPPNPPSRSGPTGCPSVTGLPHTPTTPRKATGCSRSPSSAKWSSAPPPPSTPHRTTTPTCCR